MPTCGSAATKGGGATRRNEPVDVNYIGFSATAKGDRTYGMDPKEIKFVEDFFDNNSNHQELVDKMSRSERDDFDDWTVGHFMNGQMYREFSKLSKDDQRRVRTYDKYLDKSELTTGITVTRLSTAELIFGKGKKTATLEQLQTAEGKTITCKSCLSTGAASEGLKISSGGGQKTVEYSIKIPPGKGRGMWLGSRKVNPTWGPEQREFMTNRDAIYKVGKTKYDAKRKVYKVEITMLGVGDHDYS